jgi:hypothetical protein
MFDTETLRPVIIGMTVYIILANILPKVIKEPTGFKPFDELVMLLIAQKGSMMAGAILAGLVVYLANYINEEML